MDTLAESILDYMKDKPNGCAYDEYWVTYFDGLYYTKIAEDLELNPEDVLSCIHYLETTPFVETIRRGKGPKGFKLTHAGKHYKDYQVEDNVIYNFQGSSFQNTSIGNGNENTFNTSIQDSVNEIKTSASMMSQEDLAMLLALLQELQESKEIDEPATRSKLSKLGDILTKYSDFVIPLSRFLFNTLFSGESLPEGV